MNLIIKDKKDKRSDKIKPRNAMNLIINDKRSQEIKPRNAMNLIIKDKRSDEIKTRNAMSLIIKDKKDHKRKKIRRDQTQKCNEFKHKR